MKILIIRLSSIGDIVLTSPVMRCLYNQTQYELHYLTNKQNISLVENNPYIKKVIAFEKNINKTVRLLKPEKYDYIIDLHNNPKSFKIKLRLRARSSSLAKFNFRYWFYVNFKVNLLPNNHIVDRYLQTLKQFKIKNDGKGLDFYISKDEKIPEDTLVPEKYFVFAIGTQHFTKTIPEEYILKIINKVNDIFPIVLIGGEKEIEAGKSIESLSKNVINCVGKLNLQQSAIMINNSQLVFSGDTGMMHIAAALNKNLISLWGSTAPVLGFYPYFPSGYSGINHYVERNDLKCRPCSKFGKRKCPYKHFNCTKYNDNQISEIRKIILKNLE